MGRQRKKKVYRLNQQIARAVKKREKKGGGGAGSRRYFYPEIAK
jgi:hypothetical protein